MMRIAVANLFQLTNKFNHRLTGRQNWSRSRQLAAAPLDRMQSGTTALMQSMIHASSDHQSIIVPILEAIAPAGGPSTTDARDALLGEFSQHLREHAKSVDALILVLSGCMLDEGGNSIDAELLKTARDVLTAERPLVALWSNLANLDEEMIELTDLSLSYDLCDSAGASAIGQKAIDIIHRLSRHEIRPEHAFRSLPLLLPPGVWRDTCEPCQTIRALAHDFESQPGVYDVSIFAGFPYADDARSGLSLVVSADSELDLAQNLATRLRTAVWTNRDAFFTGFVNIETVVHEAMQSEDHPVVILDAGDDPELGAPSEGTGMLWALIDLGAQNAALAAIVDPAAVETAIAAGVDSALTFDLGGRTDHSAGYPVEVKAHVRRILGRAGADYGRAVRLEVEGRHGGSVEVIVCEQPVAPLPELFEALGIDLASKQMVALKSAWRTRATFSEASRGVLETTTPGITTPVLSFFHFQRVPRPIYPLDPL